MAVVSLYVLVTVVSLNIVVFQVYASPLICKPIFEEVRLAYRLLLLHRLIYVLRC